MFPGGCLGVDLNRNFPSGWGEGHKTFVVDSSLPWTGVYKGPTRGFWKMILSVVFLKSKFSLVGARDAGASQAHQENPT